MERTNGWLRERLEAIWHESFADVPRASEVMIAFGRKSGTRLGSIRRRPYGSLITITGYFRDGTIPDDVVQETIAHELVHYSHGFESPLPKLYRYPHEGNIVTRELRQRGLGNQHDTAKRWLRDHWRKYIKTHHL